MTAQIVDLASYRAASTGTPMSGGRRRPGRGCRGKIRHPDETSAAAHVSRLVAGGAAPGAYHPYRCGGGRRGCGGWHVGHHGHHFAHPRNR